MALEDYREYAQNLMILANHKNYEIPPFLSQLNLDGSKGNKIIINSDFFNMIHKFKVNDEIILSFGDTREKYKIVGILNGTSPEAFAYISYDNSSERMNHNFTDILYIFNRNTINFSFLRGTEHHRLVLTTMRCFVNW